ncbi:S8 family serine peptidase [Marinobacter sp. 2_MG-2023]|uniref:S8 family serine peptidase n=1 Tax=Marinobacter sp. 2_MG-2023 TaxID=3062679 RepID=UPI0026E25481|nr:S8 family serine peptidase [Marinobacter sp. 2_MG-2023]MDO6442614.1 S8 family serine peptidase [Marinobacter sp. 2_MG-2023]
MTANSRAAILFRCSVLVAVASLYGCGGSSGGSEPASANIALSGIIDIETGTRVDADDADTLALSASPLGSSQLLPQEFILAGYVSVSDGTYPDQNEFPGNNYPADPVDTFSMTLREGQSVYLQPFSTSQGFSPLALSLLSGSRVIESVVTNNQVDPIRVSLPDTETAGAYTLQVGAIGAAPMLYILTTSAAGSARAIAFEWPDHDFVDAEAIVVLKADKDSVSMRSTMPLHLMEPKQELASGVWLMKAPSQMARSSQAQPKEATLEWIRTLNRRPEIASATPNYKMRAMQTPLDEPLYDSPSVGQQWHYELLNAPIAWQIAPDGGSGVTLAVMDTGLFGAPGNWHSDLNANIIEGWDFVSEEFDNDGMPGPDSNPSDPGNAVGSSVYHGTHVAGTIAAAVNGAGGAGIAYKSSLLPVRVLGEGGTGSSADLLAALRWVAGPSGGEPLAEIVNLSLGGLPFLQPLQDAITYGADRGIVFVAAAGNSASAVASYPAAFDKVFAVSAVDGAGVLASYSNYGSWIDVAAPGGDASRDGNADGRSDLVSSSSAALVNGTVQETYIGLQGTSMAAPHVSAVFALMKNLNSALGYEQLNDMLMTGKLTCGSEICLKSTELGWGLLDAGKSALAAAAGTVSDFLTASPSIVSLSTEGELSASVSLNVYGSAPSDIIIGSVSVVAPWLRLDSAPVSGDSGTDFAISVTLLPEALEAGISERTTIVIEYRSDELRRLEIPVIGQWVTDQQARDAGRHFVLLVDPEPVGDRYTTVAQTIAVAENGQYQFSFLPDDGEVPRMLNEVPPGDYILVAGTDLDNDGLICHAGEACAEYPVAGLREEITIRQGDPVTGVRMTTSYSRPSISAATPGVLPRPAFIGYRLIQQLPDTGGTAPKTIGAER